MVFLSFSDATWKLQVKDKPKLCGDFISIYCNIGSANNFKYMKDCDVCALYSKTKCGIFLFGIHYLPQHFHKVDQV